MPVAILRGLVFRSGRPAGDLRGGEAQGCLRLGSEGAVGETESLKVSQTFRGLKKVRLQKSKP